MVSKNLVPEGREDCADFALRRTMETVPESSTALISFSLLLVLLQFLSGDVYADVTVPPLFSDHAVLQRSESVPIWGTANPGESVRVSVAGASATTVANEHGKWKAFLDLESRERGPHVLKIDGLNKLEFDDILIGEVWICAGQSNMEWYLNLTNDAKEEIANSNNSMLRLFQVTQASSFTPSDNLRGAWGVAGPQTTGNFSAVAYYFGKQLNKELGAPVGIIAAHWGGTTAEAWTSEEAIDSEPDLKATKDHIYEVIKEHPRKRQEYAEKIALWLQQTGRKDRVTVPPAEFTASEPKGEWLPVKLPGSISPKTGAFWIRCEIEIPAASAGKLIQLDSAALTGTETVYWNGQKIFESLPKEYLAALPRKYTIPPELVKPGKTIIAIRIFAPVRPPKLAGKPGSFRISKSPLPEEWMISTEFELPQLSESELATAPVPPDASPSPTVTPSVVSNGMLSPLIPYAIRGVGWYQGENNVDHAYQYRTSFPLMIRDWRSRWNREDLPFYFIQLPNFGDKSDTPEESAWAELREAQSMALSLPGTAMATIIETGDSKNIHPRNKKEVGLRLAAIALGKTYDLDIPFVGPQFKSMQIQKGYATIQFTHVEGGLVAKPLAATYSVDSAYGLTAPLILPKSGSDLQGFAVCGEDKVWKWAHGKVLGKDQVVLWSEEVPHPVAVRYAWADNPTCNLYNTAGFPAPPFRTDTYPGITAGSKH